MRRGWVVVVVLVAALALVVPARPAAALARITGAGSTFAQIMIDQWRFDFAVLHGDQVGYTANGSGAGRNQFASGVVDWASSDVPYLGLEAEPSRPFAYAPLVAGGTALMYNLRDAAGRRIDGLRLTGELIAKVFTTEITHWRDPAILAAQVPGVAARLPDMAIQPVVRAESSGTTVTVMQFMAHAAPDVMQNLRARYEGDYRTPAGTLWTDVFPRANRPPGVGLGVTYVAGSFGLANVVANANSNGAIGYAEAGFALAAGLPMAYVENPYGNFVRPTPRNVAVALLGAERNPDGTQDLAGVFANPKPAAYPISSYTYAIVPTGGLDPDKGATLGQFLIHALTEGQSKAARLRYSPLPPNLVEQGFDVVRQIPGAPDPGPLGDWGQDYLELATPGPGPFRVDTTADAADAAPGDRRCATAAGACSLRAAVLEANALPGLQVVVLPPGVYTLALGGASEDQSTEGDLDVLGDLELRGAGARRTIVRAAPHTSDRVLEVGTGATVRVDSITLANGSVDDSGGVVSNHGILTLFQATVRDGLAAGDGGGIASTSGGILSLRRTTVSGNHAENGGGGIAIAGQASLANSTVSGNTVGTDGSGLGGGIRVVGSHPVSVIDSTVAANTAPTGGSAVSVFDFGDRGVELRNSILAGAADGPASPVCEGPTIRSLGWNLATDGSCALTRSTDLPATDPLLGSLANNGGQTDAHLPAVGSLAIDTGADADRCPPTDQRGRPRPLGIGCDRGSVERET